MEMNEQGTCSLAGLEIERDTFYRAVNQLRRLRASPVEKLSPLEKIAVMMLEQAEGSAVRELLEAVLIYRIAGTALWIAYWNPHNGSCRALLDRCAADPGRPARIFLTVPLPEEMAGSIRAVLRQLQANSQAQGWLSDVEKLAIEKISGESPPAHELR